MFDRAKPCKTCPFRKQGGLIGLGEEKASEIVSALLNDQTFTCHDDIDLPSLKRNHCVGAMILLEKLDKPNQMMRISERLGGYDRTKLTGHDEVFKTFRSFISNQSE